MKDSKKLDPMSIRLDPEVKAALEIIAQQEDRSLSYVINRVLRQYVETVKSKTSGRGKN